MAFTNPNSPNLTDFITFCQNQGVQTGFLPSDSPYFIWAFNWAVAVALAVPNSCVSYTIGSPPTLPNTVYVIAVYNLGMHKLIEIAQDLTAQPLTALSWSSSYVTATTTNALDLVIGTTVGVTVAAAVPYGYNVSYVAPNPAIIATVVGTNSFTYPMTVNPGTETSPGVFGTLFFTLLRQQFNLLSFIAGPVASSGDQGTNQSLVVPQWLETATLSTNNLLKTPWGQAYLEYAQMYGPTVVGLS
jgi:hypothetical protein